MTKRRLTWDRRRSKNTHMPPLVYGSHNCGHTVKLDPFRKPHQNTMRHQNWTKCARLFQKLLPSLSRANCLIQRNWVNVIGVWGDVAPLLQMENMTAYVTRMLNRLLLSKFILVWIAIQSHDHAALYGQLLNSLPTACCLTETSAPGHNISFTRATQHC